jgi:hypothetical protein
MVQSKFNLVFWFVSYNIFFIIYQVGPYWILLSLLLSHARSPALFVTRRQQQRQGRTCSSRMSAISLHLADEVLVAYGLPFPVQLFLSCMCQDTYRMPLQAPVRFVLGLRLAGRSRRGEAESARHVGALDAAPRRVPGGVVGQQTAVEEALCQKS